VLQKNQSLAKYPTDMGLLDGTFVTPTGGRMPSIFRSPRSFFKLQWKHLVFRMRDLLTILTLKVISPKGKRWYNRRMKISRMTIAPTAIALHRQMYSAFAEGDVTTLQKICTDGICETFRSRIGNRAKGEKVTWELVKYNQRAKLISHRGVRLPIDGMAFRQAVVRIASTQKLTRWIRGKGGVMEMVPGSGKTKDVVEYVVVQRRTVNNEEEAWMIWGTTGETGLDKVREWESRI